MRRSAIHALNLDEFERYDDEALRRTRRAPSGDREWLVDFLPPGEREELLAPEVVRRAAQRRMRS